MAALKAVGGWVSDERLHRTYLDTLFNVEHVFRMKFIWPDEFDMEMSILHRIIQEEIEGEHA